MWGWGILERISSEPKDADLGCRRVLVECRDGWMDGSLGFGLNGEEYKFDVCIKYIQTGNLHFLLVPPLSCHCCWPCSWWPAAVNGVRVEWLLSYWNDHHPYQILCLHCPPESYLSRWCPLERDFLLGLLNCEEQAEDWMGGPESICGYRIGPADLVIYLLGLCRIWWIRVFVYGQIPLH